MTAIGERNVFEKHSKSAVVFDFRDAGKSAGESPVVEFFLREGASLEALYLEPCRGAEIRFYLERGSALRVFFLSRDSAVVENRIVVRFKGEDASAFVAGLAVLSGGSKAAYDLTMDHECGRSQSGQFFKSILAGRSRSEFRSLVHVHPGAQKSDSRQLNKNLILSDSAEAYSRPELKILADDVSCSHGSATGQIEETELFYLESRGISRAAARYLLICGFAEEVAGEVRDKNLKALFEARIAGRLKAVAGDL